jgi:hypothetical protein
VVTDLEGRSGRLFDDIYCTRAVHLVPQTERSHICPHLFDVIQALLLRPLLTHIPPIRRVLSVRGPNRVLFLVVNDNLVYELVLLALAHGLYNYRKPAEPNLFFAKFLNHRK